MSLSQNIIFSVQTSFQESVIITYFYLQTLSYKIIGFNHDDTVVYMTFFTIHCGHIKLAVVTQLCDKSALIFIVVCCFVFRVVCVIYFFLHADSKMGVPVM